MVIHKFQYYNRHHLLIFISMQLLQCTWSFGTCTAGSVINFQRMAKLCTGGTCGFNNPTCPSMRPCLQEGTTPGDNSVSHTVLWISRITLPHSAPFTKNRCQKHTKAIPEKSRQKASIRWPRTPLRPSNPQYRYFSGKYQLPATFYSFFILPNIVFIVVQ